MEWISVLSHRFWNGWGKVKIYDWEIQNPLLQLRETPVLQEPSNPTSALIVIQEFDEEYLRYVGQFRSQLMIEWKMYREALAWICLECELYPANLRREVVNIKRRIMVNLAGISISNYDA